MTTVVITGIAGFIGSNLADGLLAKGHKVVGIDDLSTGRICNIKHLLTNRDTNNSITFTRSSINDTHMLMRVFRGADYVFHQAAIPSVPRSVKDPIATNKANVTGTLDVLLAARDCGVKKVIFASSSSVYGDTPTLPKREDMPTNPQSPYAVSKLAGENYCRAFEKVYGLSTVCLRYFNVYGPRQDPNSQYSAVIPRFMKALIAGESPVVYGDGGQSRDFTFVDDVVKANIIAMNDEVSGVFNISGGNRTTVNEMLKLMTTHMGISNVKVEHATERPGDIRHSLADINKARELGFNPKYGVQRGLIKTIESMRETK